jgi:N-methylhydantoinase B
MRGAGKRGSLNQVQSGSNIETAERLDSLQLAVLDSRFEAVARAMQNTLLRSARTGVLAVAHDFSCAVLTRDGDLLSLAESIPIHVLHGPKQMALTMKEFHPELKRGDAFLHNSGYHGCSHSADWTVLIPIIDDDGEHQFTVLAKAHQGDCGNSIPTTYMWQARDIYEEGALIFPAIKIQEDYRDNEDIIRMCKMRIRAPEHWWGDYLALMGSARIGERRVAELIEEFGAPMLQAYSEQWMQRSEDLIDQRLRALPKGKATATTIHDPLPLDSMAEYADGIPIKVTVETFPEDGRMVIDLRDNPDCLPSGINLSEACAKSAALIGVFLGIGSGIPTNGGSLKRLEVLVRPGCCVGNPVLPYSCSASTTNLQDRVANAALEAIAEIADGWGMGQFGYGQAAGGSVISGIDPRTGKPFVNQLYLAASGGPGTPFGTDGWFNSYTIGGVGMLYKDSIEVDEQIHPIRVVAERLIPDSEGPGARRGAHATFTEFGPVGGEMDVVNGGDGSMIPARGARGGGGGTRMQMWRRRLDGTLEELSTFHRITLADGETLVGISCSGGGYGPPTERDPEHVAKDVLERFVSVERAREVYGVVCDEDGTIDLEATAGERAGAMPELPTSTNHS